MPTKRDAPWKITVAMLLGGIAGMIILLSIAAIADPEPPSWLPAAALCSALIFAVGGILAWAYGLRFYLRIYTQLPIARSAVYLVIAVGATWASPFIFMLIEGRDRFFGIVET